MTYLNSTWGQKWRTQSSFAVSVATLSIGKNYEGRISLMRSNISRFWEGTDEKFAKPMPIPSRPGRKEMGAAFLVLPLSRTCRPADGLDSGRAQSTSTDGDAP